MGRHSRRGAAPQGSQGGAGAPVPGGPGQAPPDQGEPGGDPGRPGARSGSQEHAGPGQGVAARAVQQARGGHPEQRESGGGWGSAQRYGDWQGVPRAAAPVRRLPSSAPGGPLIPGPRSEFIDAFDAFDAFDAPPLRPVARRTAPDRLALAGSGPAEAAAGAAVGGPGSEEPGKGPRSGKGRAFAGIAAAAVITVLAVVVTGRFLGDGAGRPAGEAAAGRDTRGDSDVTSRSDGRLPDGGLTASPPVALAAPPATYDQLMTRQFPLSATLKASGVFTGVPGFVRAPGEGRKFRYRVDVEKGLGLDGRLFADAVQRTLNDDRSWAHDGEMTFERISSGTPDFVITLASPGTTAVWCAKSGLDTTEDNVSCDSASTDRVMINAYRWARGSETYGDNAMFTYRQMLINHEVGHRLGHNHVNCRTPGTLAPVMQQQTKSLDIDRIKCLPNPWVFPED